MKNPLPQIEIEDSVLAMHDRFEVDAEKIGWVLLQEGKKRRDVERYVVAFDAFYPNIEPKVMRAEEGNSMVGGYNYFEEDRDVAHIICGRPTDIVYLEGGFEHVLLHEIGHHFDLQQFRHWRLPRDEVPTKKMGKFIDVERGEIAAEAFVDKYISLVGTLVDYAFKTEYTDALGTKIYQIKDLQPWILVDDTLIKNIPNPPDQKIMLAEYVIDSFPQVIETIGPARTPQPRRRISDATIASAITILEAELGDKQGVQLVGRLTAKT